MTADRGLRVGPRSLYSAKAAVTRLRSAWWLARSHRTPPQRDGLRILFYHRVSDERDELAVSVDAFARQMAAIEQAGYRGAHVGEIVAALEGVDDAGTPLVGLSFDDGYLDVAEHALPLVERHGFTATVFIATGVAAGRIRYPWYDRQPPVLGSGDIARLDGGALCFEAHTISHPNLLAIDEEDARREIAGSKSELEAWLGRAVSGFCYPAGAFSPRDRRLAEEAGFRWAASCDPGVNPRDCDRLKLARIQVDARDALLDFRAKLLGGHDRPLPVRGLYRRVRYGGGTPRAASSRS